MSNCKLKLKMTHDGRGTVELDGKQIPVTNISISCGLGQLNEAVITLLPDEVSIEGDFNVTRETTQDKE